MPLSEHEQKLLEQMERALAAEDPKFATQMKGSHKGGLSRSRLLVGVLAALLGLSLVVVGVSTQLIVVGGIGFAIMVAGVAWAISPGVAGKTVESAGVRRAPGQSGGKPKKAKTDEGFMTRMEERWDKRRQDDGR